MVVILLRRYLFVYDCTNKIKIVFDQGSHKIRLFGGKKKSNMTEMHREFHSSPDLASIEAELAAAKPHRSQEDVGSVLRPLPPSHPPPPPPTSQVPYLTPVTSAYVIRPV